MKKIYTTIAVLFITFSAAMSNDIVWRNAGFFSDITGITEFNDRIALYVNSDPGMLKILNAADFTDIMEMENNDRWASWWISGDGRLLAYYNYDNEELIVKDIDQNKIIHQLEPGIYVQSMKFIPGNRDLIFFGSQDTNRYYKKLDYETGDIITYDLEFGGNYDILNQVFNISPDGKTLVVTSQNNFYSQGEYPVEVFVIFIDIETGEAEYKMEHRYPVRDVSFSPEGKYMLTSGGNYRAEAPYENIFVWDVNEREVIHKIADSNLTHTWSMYSSDGKKILSFANNNYQVYDAQTYELESSTVSAVSYKPVYLDADTLYLYAGLNIYATDINNFNPQIVYEYYKGNNHTSDVRMVNISPDNKYVISSDYDGKAKIWDFETGDFVQEFVVGSILWSSRFSPDNKKVLIATSTPDNAVYEYDLETEMIKKIGDFSNALLDAVYSPDGSKIAVAPYDDPVRIFDAETGEMLYERDFGHWIHRVQFTPDGTKLGVADGGRNFHFWDYRADEILIEKEIFPVFYSSSNNDFIFTDDGKRAAFACGDGFVRILNLQNGAIEKQYTSETDFSFGGGVIQASIKSVDFAVGDKYLLAAFSTILKMWNTQSNEVIYVCEDIEKISHYQDVNFADVTSDGNYAVAGTRMGDVIKIATPLAPVSVEKEMTMPTYAYPNPAKDIIYLDYSSVNPSGKLMIYDNSGVLAVEYSLDEVIFTSDYIKINTAGLASGIYFYRILDGGKVSSGSFVIAR